MFVLSFLLPAGRIPGVQKKFGDPAKTEVQSTGQ